MTCVRFVLAGLLLSSTAFAQIAPAAGPETTPDRCLDGADNDGNGLADCADPKCVGLYVCGSAALIGRDDERVSARGLMAAGGVMIALGVGVAASSSAVFLEAIDNANPSKAIMEYVVGGVMGVAGAALAIGGAVLVKRGVSRHRDDVALGLAFNRIDLRVTF